MKKIRVPPMLSDLLAETLLTCDGILFDRSSSCPYCGGDLFGYDVKERQFAVIIDDKQKRTIHVSVRRYCCRRCGKISYADQPFYPGTRIGSPVVDLCVTLGEMMPYTRAAVYLAKAGIIVDRWSVRNYARKGFRAGTDVEMFGIRLPASVVALSALVTAVQEGRYIDADGILAACGYPSRVHPGNHQGAIFILDEQNSR
jgi:hypothetical protein